LLENRFKTELIKEIKNMFPGCMVFHLDPNEYQGIPDLLILHEHTWASLEGKKDKNAPYRPNQEYYIDLMDKMSFSMTIYPENKKEVLYELQETFRSRGTTCIS